MAIALTSNDISTRGINNTNLAQFAGRSRQVVININDGYRPIVMDGSTVGGKFKCASLDEVDSKVSSAITAAKNEIQSGTIANAATASKLATARSIILTGNATGSTTFDGSDNVTINVTVTSASSANSATKATQDASGNIITSTYATKTELGNKLDTSTANSTFATKTEVTQSLSAKLDSTTAASTYATKTELGNKLDTSTANSTFATKTEVTQGLSSKLDSATAASTYATKAQVPTITKGTKDLTAGSSSLATGTYYFVYE